MPQSSCTSWRRCCILRFPKAVTSWVGEVKMSDELTTPTYTGVVRHSCTKQIPVPQTMVDRAVIFDVDDRSIRQEMRALVLNLRCKACVKENLYGISDIKEICGTPLSF